MTFVHYVSLDVPGGVEQQFVEFVAAAARAGAQRHAVVACGRGVHPLVRERLDASGVALAYAKYTGAIKLPKWPYAIRAAHQRRVLRGQRAAAVIVWNRLRDGLNTLTAAGGHRCIYWERGASWFAGDTPAKRRFLNEVGAVLCNSHAARRMLELRWGYRGRIRVIPNALRPSLAPAAAAPRRLARDRPLRLGVAARLVPVKGVALAIHALAELRSRGLDAELTIAGDGGERARLVALVKRLDLAGQVRFRGWVADMADFYARIDLLVHPALREPFGQIAVEAGAHGVPAVVAAVDGLVEAIAHGETGLCVTPTLALAHYRRLGGSREDLPPLVYDPYRDVIAAPRLVEPARLADAVLSLVDHPARYARMSTQAIATVGARFDFQKHVRQALSVIDGFIDTAELTAPVRSDAA